MRYLDDYSDDRLKGSCIHCGAGVEGTKANNDHAPSKCLLHKPYPENLPVVKTCIACNNSFSKDEEYVSVFLQCVLIGSTNPDDHRDCKVRKALRRSNKFRERIERSRSENESGKERTIVWTPELVRVNNVILKNARGHAFYELGERPEIDPIHVWAMPLCTLADTQRRKFEGTQTSGLEGWPEVGSRAMQRTILGCDFRDSWVIVQDKIYRYQVVQGDGVIVRSVLMEYLATEVYWSEY